MVECVAFGGVRMVVRADGKDELSGWEALADVGFGNRLVGRVSLAERGTWK